MLDLANEKEDRLLSIKYVAMGLIQNQISEQAFNSIFNPNLFAGQNQTVPKSLTHRWRKLMTDRLLM